ncbi:tRNA (adenosine(37)-N6)-threonylcarbamoyltransferase complex dimerization subunit type 1 TsaB [Myxococcota bacterium]|nr:tRNA (adenosine(37)-N6)-threonylcarbamoyltransferase complex dimerization subunit type 1 TsaB [Myxococcota bacterium]
MRILALDTSSERLLLSLGDGGSDEPVAAVVSTEKNHGPGLLSHVEGLFAGQDPTQVDAIACGRGPGSFTGIRIGLSFAKTFAYVRRIPLYTFDLFDLYFTLAGPSGPVWVLEDARRGELYVAGRINGSNMRESGVTTLEGVLETAPAGVRFFGSGAKLHLEQLRGHFGEASVVDAERLPDATTLHRAALHLYFDAEPCNPVTAEPLYLRASDAEVNLASGKIRSSWSRVVPGHHREE